MTKAAEQKAFRDALKSGQFDAVYYFHGDEEHLKEEAVRQLLAAAVDPATQAFNLDQRKGGDLQAEALGTMLATPPMMAARRVVVIRDVEGLRKDARTMLNEYTKHPSPDAVVVLVAGVGAKPDKQLSGVATAVECGALTGAQLPKWIARQVERAGATITERAIALLQDVVGSDLMQLALEIEKLASYAGDAAISEEAVTAVVGIRREETLGHLLDAVAQRNAAEALAALPQVLQQPKASAVTVVMALAVQTLALAWGEARGLHAARLSQEFFALLKEAGSAYTGRSWGEAVSAWTKAVPRWTARDLDHALAALAAADAALKETRLSSDEQLLSTLILTLCRTPASQRAA
jgi:DNA polymerase III subunit delta